MSSCSSIFFENKKLLVLHKAANILSVRSRFHSQKPEETVLDQFGKLLPVHRLDREVEGLIVAAKDKKTQSICNSWFEKKKIKKSYRALSCEVSLEVFERLPFQVEKIQAQVGEELVWKSKILRGKKRSYEHKEGDIAETHARLVACSHLANQTKVYQWELNPITGRAHQLRFELAKHSHPILGDELYFAPLLPHYSNGIALIAHSLNFKECIEREELELPETLSLNISWETFLSRLSSNAIQVAEKE